MRGMMEGARPDSVRAAAPSDASRHLPPLTQGKGPTPPHPERIFLIRVVGRAQFSPPFKFQDLPVP